MEIIQVFSYLNGMCSALHFTVCLLCGLQLCFGLLHTRKPSNILISRYVGIIFLMMSFTTVCYILSALSVLLEPLFVIGSTIDLVTFAMIVCVGYMLWTNTLPSRSLLYALAAPFTVLAILNVFLPSCRDYIPDIASAVMLSYFVFFEFKLRKHDRFLEDLYSDPESHSSKWRWSLVVFLAGWFTFRHIFLYAELVEWYDAAMYLLMSIIILYVFVKIINFGSPVSLETLNQVEQDNCSNDVSHEAATPLQAAFLKLLDEKQVFLKPDLTVEDVVKDLGTNTKYFSRMLHNEMHTSFCGIINSYRVERAKELLKSTDGKIEVIAGACGFNSHYSFIRTFSRITGKTPNEWRNM